MRRLWSRLTISTKLMATIGAVVLVAGLVISLVAFRDAERAFRTQATSQLEAVRSSRARQITTYLARVQNDIRVSSRLLVTRQALAGMPAALRAAPRGTSPDYRRLRGLVQPVAQGLIEALKISDVLLIGTDGTVLYSTASDGILGANLRAGALRATGLGDVWQRAARAAAADDVYF